MKHFIIGTAGHVDHGKTALIKTLTQIDCDTHKQEKERGITINLGFAHIELPNGMSCGIVDMPGHKDFIDTMVSGACGIDLVLLIVAADSGIMPQTVEHLNILNTLGVQKGIVVITKTDLVDEDFIELVTLEVLEKLEGTSLEGSPIIPVSAHSGAGIAELVAKIAEIGEQVEERNTESDFRMYPDRIFEVKGIGYVLTGSVLSGELKVGDDVFLLPGRNKQFKVRGIQRHGHAAAKAIAGDRAAINLTGLKVEDFTRGMILSKKELEENQMIDAQITVFHPSIELSRWSDVLFHSGTFQSHARMHLLTADKLKNGEVALAQIHLDKEAVLQKNDRFILRNTSNDNSIGGGIIFDAHPLHHRKRTKKLVEHVTQLAEAVINGSGLQTLIVVELQKNTLPERLSSISEKLKVSTEEIVAECKENSTGEIACYGSGENAILLHQKKDRQYADTVFELLTAHHQKYPLSEEGLELNEFVTKLELGGNPIGKRYVEKLIEKLILKSEIKKTGKSFTLASHEVKIDKKTQEQLEWLEDLIEGFGMQKPIMADIELNAREQKINKDRLFMMLNFLQNKKKIYIHDKDVLHARLVDKCRKLIIEDLKKRPRGMNEGDFKNLIDGTKKIIHPLLGIYLKEGIIEQEIYIIKISEKGRALV